MEQELLEKLVDFFSKVSPAVWEVLLKKAVFDGYMHTSIGILILQLWFWIGKIKKSVDDVTINILFYLLSVASTVALVLIVYGISIAFNPEYYALKYLLNMVK